ncbi:18575_t:CDS:2 [Funneliformis geosporum]|uniref:18575_t:CDS:1 n=1 Tax=Funneliformis geosporum TaxID=1117311 RepID=A0A9W4T6A4_9GLOM|nr:18575_t:CDS:2 [Funneliformis geosporum]
MSSKFKLTQDLFESARNQLLEQETQIILAKNVSLEDFLKVYLDYTKNEQNRPVKIRLVNKKVIAYEVALTPHGVVANYITSLAWINQLAGASEKDLIIGPNSYFTATATIRPRRVPRPSLTQACNSSGFAYPTMVVERTTIMIVLIIKIYPSRQNNARAFIQNTVGANVTGFVTGAPLAMD